MAAATTVRLDIRKGLLAIATALASGGPWLAKSSPGCSGAAAGQLVAAELALVDLANVWQAYAGRRGGAAERDALLVLKIDSRNLEAFSGDWLDAAAPDGHHTPAWQMAHLVNALDFGRWLVALSASALAARGDTDTGLQDDAIRTILQLDMALTELTRACLGRHVACLSAWTA